MPSSVSDLKAHLQQLEKRIRNTRNDFTLHFEMAKDSINQLTKNLKDRHIEMIEHAKAAVQNDLEQQLQAVECKQRDLLKCIAEMIFKAKQIQGKHPEKLAEIGKALLGFRKEMREIATLQQFQIRSNSNYDAIASAAESTSRLFYVKQLRFHPKDVKIWIDETCNKLTGKPFCAFGCIGEDGQDDCLGLDKCLVAVLIDPKANTHPAKIEPLQQNNQQVGVRMWFVPVKRGPYEMHVTLYGEPVPDSPLKFQIDVPIVPPIILIKPTTHTQEEMMIEEKKADVVMMDVDVNMKDVIGGGDSMPKTSTGDGHSLIKAGAGGVTKRRTHSPIRAPETTATEKRQRKCLLAPHGGSGINVTSLVDLADYVSVQHPNEGIKAEFLFSMGESPGDRRSKSAKYAFQNPQGCKQDEQTKDFLLCDMENHVGGFKQMTDAKIGMSRPSAVVVDQHKRAFFVKDDRQLYEFDSRSAKLLSTFRQGTKTGSNLFGLAQTPSGMLATIAEQRKEQVMCIYDPRTGGQVDAFVLKFGDFSHTNPNRWSKFRFIDSYADKLAISDYGVSRVLVCDVNDGELLLEFGRRGKMAGEMLAPSGLSFDGNGNLLVADSKNQRIQLYDKSGRFICPLRIRKDMGCPSDIHLTSDAKLIVSSRSDHFVGVFQLHKC